MQVANQDAITYIGLNKSDIINIQEVIYHVLFLEYLKTFIYGIVYIIPVYGKSENDIQKLLKNVSLFLFILIIFIFKIF